MENLTPEIMKLIKTRLINMDFPEFDEVMENLAKDNKQLAILMEQNEDAVGKVIRAIGSRSYIQGWRDCYKFFGIEDMMEK